MTAPAPAETPVLCARSLWKLYGPATARLLAGGARPDAEALRAAAVVGAVRDVSLEVARGEIFVIMGLSGSGKSTLVRCLARLIEPTAGQVIFDGVDLTAASRADLIRIRRHRMGMVFQHFALLPHLTVLENVAFPLRIQGVARAAREARAAEVIALVGLAGREAHYPRQLSGGQQQRVGIARSLAGEPDLWFLDEPFSALDPLIRREMQDELVILQKTLKKTSVFITHDLTEALLLGDRIAIMKDGRFVQVATPEDLVLSPADPYVAAFTAHVARAKVVTLGRIMTSGPAPAVAGSLPAAMRVEDAADRIEASPLPWAVTDAAGRVIGHVGARAVIDVALGRPLPGGGA
ncbi:MAG: glycine betaine/L-proline ABC transporter ATP-binding protein [Gemmobacter sp.]